MQFRRLTLRGGGMFSNVNEVVQRLHLAEHGGYPFVIDWSASNYQDPEKQGDPWSYFFEPCFSDAPSTHSDLDDLPDGEDIVLDRRNIITPRATYLEGHALLLPKDRHLPHQYIERHIRLKPEIKNIVKDYAARHFEKFTIGLHIRGEGRDHGGAAELRARLPQEDGVPYAQYFQFVRAELNAHPDAQIFLCSDSTKVIDRVRAEFGDRVIYYDASRSSFGEMHERQKSSENEAFSGYKLGVDILVDAYLLTLTNVFIHGNTNVANFVICKNPQLRNIYVYDGISMFTARQKIIRGVGYVVDRSIRTIKRLLDMSA